MGLRGIIRDFVGIYLGYRIISAHLFGNLEIDWSILLCAVILLLFGIWFLLERFVLR
ncbi:MAG: hypothetical protein QMD14_02460 [Candidatus Aenigmarchaeota archaeon]|nr:hypothetical protein [Candidatus Aenigmarchaeota archaeon]